ncbi:MAG TPA: 50S ribosomal protein L21 [Candidatus Alistipes merdigallinarum]|nr:50S ribosomal protein L21 [Candidatus Alistipes merdigallinarum]
MYAIVEIAGRQFKVEKGRKLYVYRLQGDEGSSLSFDKVLLTDNDGQVKVGTPVVEGAVVNATILKHLKDDKVIVFKKRRRKGYQVKNGHRQYLTQIQIDEIKA